MDPVVKNIVAECTQASDAERVTFGEVVTTLMRAGVERYHADLVRGGKTYYLPNGESAMVTSQPAAIAPAEAFSAAGVEAAIRAIQSGEIQYGEFCRRIAAAGCAGYLVSIVGQRAVYYGRSGDLHTEWFPGARRAEAA